jgi:hypothetical protein
MKLNRQVARGSPKRKFNASCVPAQQIREILVISRTTIADSAKDKSGIKLDVPIGVADTRQDETPLF